MSSKTKSKIIDLGCSSHAHQWQTPERRSQSLSSTISPSGRYFYIVYLFGLAEIDTENGTEIYHEIHSDQAMQAEPEFNICGFISVSDDVGFTIERTEEQYGDYYFRRIQFGHEKESDFNVGIETNPLILAFDVKCLTVCYDYQVDQNELHVILRKAAEEEEETRETRLWCSFKLQDDHWIEAREPVELSELSRLNSWDLFPKFYQNCLYVFPVQPCSISVYSKLQQFNKIARVDANNGKLEIIPVKSPLEKWASGTKYQNALFVDNMDYKWIENDLFLLFIVVLQNEDRQSFFENRLATFNFDKMEWREIHIGNLCRGDISLNPYRMQITPDKRLFLLNPSHGHPCTTFGLRSYTPKKRLLWKAPFSRTSREIEKASSYDDRNSLLYTVNLGKRNVDKFISIVKNTAYKVHPQLKDRHPYEFESLLNNEPPFKKAKKLTKMEEECFEELAGDGFCST